MSAKQLINEALIRKSCRHARRGALALGQLPLNLVLTSSMSTTLPSALLAILNILLPRIARLDLSIAELNSSTYAPQSRDENLASGMLQLPEETTLFIDETAMGEGTLKDRGEHHRLQILPMPKGSMTDACARQGVRNVQALTRIVTDQTIDYIFPYSTFTFETDLKVVVLSKGYSLLPVSDFSAYKYRLRK